MEESACGQNPQKYTATHFPSPTLPSKEAVGYYTLCWQKRGETLVCENCGRSYGWLAQLLSVDHSQNKKLKCIWCNGNLILEDRMVNVTCSNTKTAILTKKEVKQAADRSENMQSFGEAVLHLVLTNASRKEA